MVWIDYPIGSLRYDKFHRCAEGGSSSRCKPYNFNIAERIGMYLMKKAPHIEITVLYLHSWALRIIVYSLMRYMCLLNGPSIGAS